MVVRQLQEIALMQGAGSEVGRDVLKAVTTLSKHISPGTVSPGIERNAAENTANKMRQNTTQAATMRAAQAQPGQQQQQPAA